MTSFARIAIAALGLATPSGASAQLGTHALTASAPTTVAASAPRPALVTSLDEQFQHLVTKSHAQRVRLAARIMEICDGLTQIEGSPVGKVEAGYVIAASLFSETDFDAARTALLHGAEFASARGEVFEAANRYLDVVMLTIRQPVRTAEDVKEARVSHARARALASSSLLSPEQRAYLLKRIN